MRHFHVISRTPQVAISNLSGALQALLVIVQLFGEVTGFLNAFEAKKGQTS